MDFRCCATAIKWLSKKNWVKFDFAFDFNFICVIIYNQLNLFYIAGTSDTESESEATAADKTLVPNFSIEYTKVDRDSCNDCGQYFKRGELRIMRFVPDMNDNEYDDMQSGEAHWYHVACFVRLRSDIGWLCCGGLLPGFTKLSIGDQELVKSQIP